MQSFALNPDPRYHTANVKRMLAELVGHLREDMRQINEPKAQALFETSAEVLQALHTAFTHYEESSEEKAVGRERTRVFPEPGVAEQERKHERRQKGPQPDAVDPASLGEKRKSRAE